MKRSLAGLLFLTIVFGTYAQDTVKVMTWNLLQYTSTSTQRNQYYRTLLRYTRPDVLAVQEMQNQASADSFYTGVVNVVFPGQFTKGTIAGSGDTYQELYCRTAKFFLIGNTPIPTVTRDINEFKLYSVAAADTIRFYVVHLKAFADSASQAKRSQEVDSLRRVTNGLPAGKYFSVLGDFNITAPTEQAYVKLLASPSHGLFVDTIHISGTWHTAANARFHTESSSSLQYRDDMILFSSSIAQGNGRISYVDSSLVPVGNDGRHWLDSINHFPNYAVPDSVANALHAAADHLPVIARFVFGPGNGGNPSLTVTSPNGGESWPIGSAQTVLWTSSNLSGNVKIDLSTDDGATFPVVIAASTANTGTLPWTVTGPATSLARIRASSLTVPSVSDTSNNHFTILQPTVTVTSPNGGEFWAVGSVHTIRWTTAGVSGPVNVELSRNGGLTYEMLFAGTVNDGAEDWSVSAPLSSNAFVRVSSVNDPAVRDTGNAAFEIGVSFSFLTKIYLTNNGGVRDSLEFGTAAGATDGIDPLYGEMELPPLPPVEVLDVRWRITGTSGSHRDVRDTLGGTRQQIIYTGSIQPGEGGYPMVLRWNHLGLPAGTFMLQDPAGGVSFNVNMKLSDSLVISNPDLQTFRVVYTAGIAVSSTVQAGWNMISLPVVVGDRRRTAVFPTSTSSAFGYTPTGYVVHDTLEYGYGYWLKFGSTQPITSTGAALAVDTVSVVQGWNMVGSISSPVPVVNIQRLPAEMVMGQFYTYAGSYISSDTLQPAAGYWVKVSQNGSLILH